MGGSGPARVGELFRRGLGRKLRLLPWLAHLRRKPFGFRLWVECGKRKEHWKVVCQDTDLKLSKSVPKRYMGTAILLILVLPEDSSLISTGVETIFQ